MVSYICSVTHCSGARADVEDGFAWALMRAAEQRPDPRLRGHLGGMLRGTRFSCWHAHFRTRLAAGLRGEGP